MISIAQFAPSDEPEIRDFNVRMSAAGEAFQLPAHPRELAIAGNPENFPWTDIWVARDEVTVRGGFLLKHERLFSQTGDVEVGNYQLPLSEGILDRRFATVGLSITHRALAEIPALYCLGMGSLTRPLPKLLKHLGWRVEEVPFFFRVVHGTAFVRNVSALRMTSKRRVALDLLGVSGAAYVGGLGWRLAARLQAPRSALPVRLLAVHDFDERADEVFFRCRADYPLLLDRRSKALNIKFPSTDLRLRRFLVEVAGETVGWLVLTINQLQGHKQFGDLRLGCIVDGLLEPQALPTALKLAASMLSKNGCDLIVSNQTHAAWQSALTQNLFKRGPSNFVLARSPAFVSTSALEALHFNRGDGDGPINL